MNWKEFLKPNKIKIILFCLYLFIAFSGLGYIGGFLCCPPPELFLMLVVLLVPIYFLWNVWWTNFIVGCIGLILELIWCYYLSCLTFWIYDKLRKRYSTLFAIFVTAIFIVGLFAVGPILYKWYGTPRRLTVVEIMDIYCSEEAVHIKIKNIGITDILADVIVVDRVFPSPEPNTPNTCCAKTLTPGETAWYEDSTCGSGNNCTYRITPPGGKTVTVTQYCE